MKSAIVLLGALLLPTLVLADAVNPDVPAFVDALRIQVQDGQPTIRSVRVYLNGAEEELPGTSTPLMHSPGLPLEAWSRLANYRLLRGQEAVELTGRDAAGRFWVAAESGYLTPDGAVLFYVAPAVSGHPLPF